MGFKLCFILLPLLALAIKGHVLKAEGRVDKPKAVQVTLYYESLCPDCQQYMTHELWGVFNGLNNNMTKDLSTP